MFNITLPQVGSVCRDHWQLRFAIVTVGHEIVRDQVSDTVLLEVHVSADGNKNEAERNEILRVCEENTFVGEVHHEHPALQRYTESVTFLPDGEYTPEYILGSD